MEINDPSIQTYKTGQCPYCGRYVMYLDEDHVHCTYCQIVIKPVEEKSTL
jgi:hypothetical protein